MSIPRIVQTIRSFVGGHRPTKIRAERAYSLWAQSYDDKRSDNVVLVLDERLFSRLLERIEIRGKVVVDFGCGTGHYWPRLMSCEPVRLVGLDLSHAMLKRLITKNPQADVCQVSSGPLPLRSDSCDVIVSNVTLGYIKNVGGLWREWHRILRIGGDVVVTDIHPSTARLLGFRRTFFCDGHSHEIESYVHAEEDQMRLARDTGFEVIWRSEQSVDDSVKRLYEGQQADVLFEKTRGLPLMLGMCLRKLGPLEIAQ